MHNFLISLLGDFKGRVNYIVFIFIGVIDASLLIDSLTYNITNTLSILAASISIISKVKSCHFIF